MHFANQIELNKSIDILIKRDKGLRILFDDVGYPSLRERANNFDSICRIVIGQQLSRFAARTVYSRFRNRIGESEITPRALLNVHHGELSGSGISKAKLKCLTLFAESVLEEPRYFEFLSKIPDDEVRNRLTGYWGIGNWTVDNYLIFCLRRQDVLPFTDGSIMRALSRGLSVEGDRIDILSSTWKPVRTAAALLLWHWLDTNN